jgi:glycosyltransferase involved in cell wall biosynthesis
VLTVFIATHNGAETLPRVLDAYTRLQAPPGGWQIVLIDNASDDGSLGIAQSFADRLPLRCMSEPTPGKNRALNRGLSALAGDLAVFADDDGVPEPDWLVQFRAVADQQSDYAIFGGPIIPVWLVDPPEWILRWVPLKPVYSATEATWEEGPCDPLQVWGANMAVRTEPFRDGCRFNEGIGPDGSPTYAMGSETEFTLRLAIERGLRCWHTKSARIGHLILPAAMTKEYILERAFHLGRCLYREYVQNAAAGRPYLERDPITVIAVLADELVNFVSAQAAANARRMFRARWQLNLFLGCLFEAGCTTTGATRRTSDG